jgi:hypothetical protein
MSWSIALIGKPDNVAKALDAASDQLSGQSKIEYDAAKPHLIALVNQNFAKVDTNSAIPTVKFSASGSGYAKDGEQIARNLSVSIDPLYFDLV